MATVLRRPLHTSTSTRALNPLFHLQALSNARETARASQLSKLPRTAHSPALQLLQAEASVAPLSSQSTSKPNLDKSPSNKKHPKFPSLTAPNSPNSQIEPCDQLQALSASQIKDVAKAYESLDSLIAAQLFDLEYRRSIIQNEYSRWRKEPASRHKAPQNSRPAETPSGSDKSFLLMIIFAMLGVFAGYKMHRYNHSEEEKTTSLSPSPVYYVQHIPVDGTELVSQPPTPTCYENPVYYETEPETVERLVDCEGYSFRRVLPKWILKMW